MKRWIGRWIIGIGVVHTIFGLVVFQDRLLAILRDGVWNAVDGYAGRPLAFWFMFVGLLMITFGLLIDWLESRSLPIPKPAAWGFWWWSSLQW